MLYVLLILTSVYGGNVMSSQEFYSLQACEAARKHITAMNSTMRGIALSTVCLPKGYPELPL